MHRRVDGLVMVDIRLEPDEVDALRDTDIRTVTIGNSYPGLSSVRPDDISAARLAVDHLLQLGHRRIGLIEGMPDDPMRTEVCGAAVRGTNRRSPERESSSILTCSIPATFDRGRAGRQPACWLAQATHRVCDLRRDGDGTGSGRRTGPSDS